MRAKNREMMLLIIAILVVFVIGLSVVYASLSQNLTVKFGNVIQESAKWGVKFQGTSVTGSKTGSATCGTATISNSTTVTVAKTTLTKPGDKCSYALTLENSGTIAAKISEVTPTRPSGITCATASGPTLVCGLATYKLRYDSATSSTQPAVGNTLNGGATKTLYLTIEFSGSTTSSSDVTHSGFGFTIKYEQY